LEVMKVEPDLVVSGINYGENLATGVTISGTIGAALEAASMGIPALAVSLEADQKYHLSHSDEVDFTVAAEFTKRFARLLLRRRFPEDVDVLKIDVPWDANFETPWALTRISRRRYYEPIARKRSSWNEPALVGYREAGSFPDEDDTDVHALRKMRLVSVSPLSLDMTSRVDFEVLERLLREQ